MVLTTLDVNTLEVNLPTTIAGYTVSNPDASYTIILNSRMTFERRLKAYEHELAHIKNGDYERKNDVNILEFYAHGIIR